ncbi:MAG: DUF2304 family protein [Saprospiraceae bacterium]
MQFYQWLVPLIALFFIIRIIRRYRNHGYNKVTAFIWGSFWIGIATLAIMPDFVSTYLARFLGFKSNVTAVIFAALGVLFIINFYLSAKLNRMERQTTNLVRMLAKQGYKEKNGSTGNQKKSKRSTKKRKAKR